MVTLIKNGTVIDGTGTPPVQQDILVRNGRVVRRGTFTKLVADEVVDANGSVVTPGFIDVGSAADAQGDLFTAAGQHSLLAQGITTVVGGHCGWSLAPWRTAADALSHTYSHLVHAPTTWHTTRELFRFLTRSPLAVNFATLIGVGALRQTARIVSGANAGDFSERDQATFEHLLEVALGDGALGVSIVYGGGDGTLPLRSVRSLATTLAASGSVLGVHYSGSSECLAADVSSLLEVVQKTKVSLCLSHFGPRVSFGSASAATLTELEHAAGSCDVHLDIHPFDTVSISLLYQTTAVPLTRASLGASQDFQSLARHLPLGITIGRVPDPSLRFLEGKTIDAFAATRGQSPYEGLLEIVRLTRGRVSFLARDVSESALTACLASPRSLIATHGYDYHPFGTGSPVPAGAHATFLQWAAAQVPQLSLEAAVHRVTGLPARVYRLRHRGTLEEGAAADILVLDSHTFLPMNVWVNGIRAFTAGVVTGARAGQALQRNRRT